MPGLVNGADTLVQSHFPLIVPLLLSLGIAWSDLRTRRIPNWLTLGGAAAGLGFQLGSHGLTGLLDGLGGLVLGCLLLWWPYSRNAMGAGDVKALGTLGAWLGPGPTLHLFVYTGICGGLLALAGWWWQGTLWVRIRRSWLCLKNWVLSQPLGTAPRSVAGAPAKEVPYGLAIALGMTWMCWRRL